MLILGINCLRLLLEWLFWGGGYLVGWRVLLGVWLFQGVCAFFFFLLLGGSGGVCVGLLGFGFLMFFFFWGCFCFCLPAPCFGIVACWSVVFLPAAARIV